MPRTLHYGGSFDPIHVGHLRCARAAGLTRGFERVVLIPGWQSPHKSDRPSGATPLDRLRMCKLATNGDEFFNVNDLEIARDGPSYTIDTVRALKRQGWTEVNWLIGADQLSALPRWRDAERLVAEANFFVMGRPSFPIEWDGLPPWLQPLRRNVVDIPLIDVSSTLVRDRVGQGKAIDDLVPPAVARFIAERGLYGSGGDRIDPGEHV